MSERKMSKITVEQEYMLQQFLDDKFPENKILVVVEAHDSEGNSEFTILRNCCESCALRHADAARDEMHKTLKDEIEIIIPDIEQAIQTHMKMQDKTKDQDASKN